ncbi:Gpi1-domain-containing protein, partial [Rhizopogon salebrosus TDB-379]
MTSVFWPSDVAWSGICYGWDNPELCVAGVLVVEEVLQESHADTLLQHVARSTEGQALIKLCGVPRVLGSCAFSSPMRTSYPQPDVTMACPTTFIYYHRHDAPSLRFYSLGTNGTRRFDLQDEYMRLSLKYDFSNLTSSRSAPNAGQTLINQWNSAKTLQKLIEHEQRTPTTAIQTQGFNNQLQEPSECLDINQKIQFTVDGTKSSKSILWHLVTCVFASLRELSVVVQQVESRARKLRRLLRGVQSVPNGDVRLKSSQYIEFYSTLWTILNDLIIGIALRQFLRQDREILMHLFVLNFEDKAVHNLRQILLWLDSWPAGLKLNTELSRFYSHSFMGLIALWHRSLRTLIHLLPMLCSALELGSAFGVTMTLAMVCDLVFVFMGHIQLCYLVSVTVYGHLLRLVASLWNLFRGKRHNVLRNRTDPWDYDVDQLLLGTMLFTLVAYLFPTVLVYYILFATMRVSIILVYASLETALAFMNHFPLFALMLRVKDPQRSPGGIYMRVEPSKDGDDVEVCLESHPLPLLVTFVQYVELWRRLVK